MKRNYSFVVTALLIAVSLIAAGCGKAEGDEKSEGFFSSFFSRGEPVVVPSGTTLTVRLTTGLSSENNEGGDTFVASVDEPIRINGKEVIPRGAEVEGVVTKVVESGRLKERAELWVTLREVEVNGKNYDLATSTVGHKEGSKLKRNVIIIGSGAGVGALIGGLTGGGKGAAIGTAIGGGGGTAAAAATGKRDIQFPPETRLRFRLTEDLKVNL